MTCISCSFGIFSLSLWFIFIKIKFREVPAREGRASFLVVAESINAITNTPIGIITEKLYENGGYIVACKITTKNNVTTARTIVLRFIYNFYGSQHYGAARILVETSSVITFKLESKVFNVDYKFYYLLEGNSAYIYIKTRGGNGFGRHYIYKEQCSDENSEISVVNTLIDNLPEGAEEIL